MANSFMYTMMRQRLTTQSWYKLGNVSVNPKLAAQVTLMRHTSRTEPQIMVLQTDYKGVVSRESIHQPKDTSKCNFEGYYDKIISHLGTNGSIYKASSDTMASTAAAIDNQRTR